MSTQISLKYRYTYENAEFCTLCIDDYKILQIFDRLSTKFFTISHRETSQVPTPQRPYMTISWTISIRDASLSAYWNVVDSN